MQVTSVAKQERVMAQQAPTSLLNYEHDTIQKLVQKHAWNEMPTQAALQAVYTFVRDEIPLGFNAKDAMPASKVLLEGYGQCNTKAILLAALLRAVGITCRFVASYVHKALQKGALGGLFYACTPQRILHTWVEAELEGRWYALEGVIVDSTYLNAVQAKFPHAKKLTGYALATPNLHNPPVQFLPSNTYIQNEAVVELLGTYSTPDEIFTLYEQEFTGFRGFVYENLVRKSMNRKLQQMRLLVNKTNPALQPSSGSTML